MTPLDRIGSSEEVALFNPAFLAVLVHDTTKDYAAASGASMPLYLAYLAPTLALHKPTREDLPGRASANVQTWIREHPRHVAGLPKRICSLRPFINAAIVLGASRGVIKTEPDALRHGTLRRRPRGLDFHGDVDDCRVAVRLLGRWFSSQPDGPTLLAMWGLRP